MKSEAKSDAKQTLREERRKQRDQERQELKEMQTRIPPSYHEFSLMGTTFCVHKRYKLIKGVGAGVYGVVAAMLDVQTQKKVAIKKVARAFESLQDARRVVREIKLLRFCNHPNILKLVRLPVPPTNREKFEDIYFITELLDTDLFKVIYSKQKLIEQHYQYFMYQILKGLLYLHSCNIMHRDLKPSNILVNANCDVKIADFGLARGVEEGKLLTEYVVTRWYRAPEVLLEQLDYQKAVDVWAAGCVFAEMMGRKPLFPGKNAVNQITATLSVLGTPSAEDLQPFSERAQNFIKNMPQQPKLKWKELFSEASQDGLDLLNQMLHFNPKKRITIEECLKHPYFKDLYNEEDILQCRDLPQWQMEPLPLTKEALQDTLYMEARNQ